MDKDLQWFLAMLVAIVVLSLLSDRVQGADRPTQIPPPDRVVQGVDKTGTKAWVCAYWDKQQYPIREVCVTFVKVSK